MPVSEKRFEPEHGGEKYQRHDDERTLPSQHRDRRRNSGEADRRDAAADNEAIDCREPGRTATVFFDFENPFRIVNDRKREEVAQRDYGENRMFGCELLPARYDAWATALGGHGELVDSADQMEGAIARAIASGKPAVINVMTESIAAPVIKRET